MTAALVRGVQAVGLAVAPQVQIDTGALGAVELVPPTGGEAQGHPAVIGVWASVVPPDFPLLQPEGIVVRDQLGRDVGVAHRDEVPGPTLVVKDRVGEAIEGELAALESLVPGVGIVEFRLGTQT